MQNTAKLTEKQGLTLRVGVDKIVVYSHYQLQLSGDNVRGPREHKAPWLADSLFYYTVINPTSEQYFAMENANCRIVSVV